MAKHSLVKSSTIVSIFKRRPIRSQSHTKSIDHSMILSIPGRTGRFRLPGLVNLRYRQAKLL